MKLEQQTIRHSLQIIIILKGKAYERVCVTRGFLQNVTMYYLQTFEKNQIPNTKETVQKHVTIFSVWEESASEHLQQ